MPFDKKWKLTDEQWEQIENDEGFLLLLNLEIGRRLFSGAAVTEQAQVELAGIPKILSALVKNPMGSTANQISAAKLLKEFAASGPQTGTAAGERFSITILLGPSEKEKFTTVVEHPMKLLPDREGSV